MYNDSAFIKGVVAILIITHHRFARWSLHFEHEDNINHIPMIITGENLYLKMLSD